MIFWEDFHICFLSRFISPHQLDAVRLYICNGELSNLQKKKNVWIAAPSQ